jgi:LysR family transcriptional regulator, hydrogen peroxide-inducible genes activator
MQLVKLEDELGAVLFDRSKTPVIPTEVGEAVIVQAKTVIREQRKISGLAQQQKDRVAGDFHLAVIPTISAYLLPLFISEFQKRFPEVRLHIDERKTDDIVRLLRADELDAGLLATPLNDESLIERVLYYEPFYLFLSPGHRFMSSRKIRQEDLELREIWLLDKGNCFRDQVISICGERELDDEVLGSIRFDGGHLETLKNMVLRGSGCTLLPHLAVRQMSAGEKGLIRPFVDPVPTREVSMVYGRSVLKKKIVDGIEEVIRECLPKDLCAISKKRVEVVDVIAVGRSAGTAERSDKKS